MLSALINGMTVKAVVAMPIILGESRYEVGTTGFLVPRVAYEHGKNGHVIHFLTVSSVLNDSFAPDGRINPQTLQHFSFRVVEPQAQPHDA